MTDHDYSEDSNDKWSLILAEAACSSPGSSEEKIALTSIMLHVDEEAVADPKRARAGALFVSSWAEANTPLKREAARKVALLDKRLAKYEM